MSISFQCPACGKGFSVSGGLAGKKAKCKQCGGVMIIPAGAPARPATPPPVDVYGLDDEPAAPPARDAAERPDERVDEPRAPRRTGGNKGPRRDEAKPKGLAKVGGVSVVLIIIILRIVGWSIRARRHEGPTPATPAPAGFAPAPALSSAPARPWTMPALPDRGPMREIQPGVTFQKVRVGPGRPMPGLPPAHGMTLYFYLPPGDHAPGSLPCVLIAPAGSIVITGMELAEGDQAEHLPYVRAGFAVLSYSLDGHVANLNAAGDAQIRKASLEFLAAKAGLINAKVALEWLTARVPEVDKDRIYTAGHSSAGTMALVLAENESRIRKCAAFAARSDVGANFPGIQKLALQQAIPGVNAFFTTYNPKQHAGDIACPVLLFHARDDSVVPVTESESFAAALRAAGKDVTLVTVPSGDHHEPMIRQGIPMAIAWFKGQDPTTATAQRPAPARRAPARPDPDSLAPPSGPDFGGPRIAPPTLPRGPRMPLVPPRRPRRPQ